MDRVPGAPARGRARTPATELERTLKLPHIAIALLLALMASAAIAASGDWRSPRQVDGATTVDVPTAARLHDRGVPFVDVRNPRLFKRKHIPGAHHLELKTAFNEQALSKIVGRNDPVVIYCSGVKCSRSYRATTAAVGWGFTRVMYFREGVVGWKKAGLPMTFADGSVHPVEPAAK